MVRLPIPCLACDVDHPIGVLNNTRVLATVCADLDPISVVPVTTTVAKYDQRLQECANHELRDLIEPLRLVRSNVSEFKSIESLFQEATILDGADDSNSHNDELDGSAEAKEKAEVADSQKYEGVDPLRRRLLPIRSRLRGRGTALKPELHIRPIAARSSCRRPREPAAPSTEDRDPPPTHERLGVRDLYG